MSDIAVRSATEADVPLILRFIRALAVYEKLQDEVVATEDGLRASLFCAEPAAEVLIASLRGAPVGFALFFTNYSTFLGQAGLYLEDVYVVPEARGKGVGLALLRELARIAIARGYGRMEWWVLDWNQPSIDFYEALGAEAMDDWTVYRLSGDAMGRLAAGS